jgi:hypothetical protein
MKNKITAGKAVAARLFPAENTIDEALIANASLLVALLTARRDAQEPCGTIQGALDGTVDSNKALMDARRAIVSAHAQIVQLRDDLGLPTTGYGCETPCLPTSAEQPKPHLRVA